MRAQLRGGARGGGGAVFMALLLTLRPLPAQSAQSVLASSIRSYQNLDLDDAAGLLTRALAFEGRDALGRPDHAKALMYLVATELLRDHRDSAFAVSRRLVAYEPRFRPSDLDFPPRTIALYDSARRATPAVFAAAPADTALRSGEALVIRLFGSTYHQIQAVLARTSSPGSVVHIDEEVAAVTRALPRLKKLDRYESRALAKRKRALRAL